MKKLLILLAILVMGCAGLNVNQKRGITETVRVPVEVSITGEGLKECPDSPKIIEGTKPEMSNISHVNGDRIYTKLFAGLSVSDTNRLWHDFTMAMDMGVTKATVYINSPGGDERLFSIRGHR